MLIPGILERLGHIYPDNERHAPAMRVERDADGKPWVVATNGRVMFAATFREEINSGDNRRPGFAAAIPASVLQQSLSLAKDGRGCGVHNNAVNVTEDGDTPKVTAGRVGYVFAPPDGKMPPWRDVAKPADAKQLVKAEHAKGKLVRVRVDIAVLSEVLGMLTDLGMHKISVDFPVDESTPVRFVAQCMNDDYDSNSIEVSGYFMPLS